MPQESTPNLSLPLLHAAQAQKELTHNEALMLIDALLAGVCAAEPMNAPPPNPSNGSLWVVGAFPGGLWLGEANNVAFMTENGWRFVDLPGGTTLNHVDGRPMHRTNTGWEIGTIYADRVKIGGVTVLGARQNAITAPTGGTVIDSQARVAIQSILTAMINHGLIN